MGMIPSAVFLSIAHVTRTPCELRSGSTASIRRDQRSRGIHKKALLCFALGGKVYDLSTNGDRWYLDYQTSRAIEKALASKEVKDFLEELVAAPPAIEPMREPTPAEPIAAYFAEKLSRLKRNIESLRQELATRRDLKHRVLDELDYQITVAAQSLKEFHFWGIGYNMGVDMKRNLLERQLADFRQKRRQEQLRFWEDVVALRVPSLLGNHYQQFLPVFASDKVLGVGAPGLGLMVTISGCGALLGSLVVATFGNVRRRGLVQLLAGMMFGLSLLVFAQMREFPLALASLAMVGFSASAYQTLNSTLTVAACDPSYFGRIASVQQMSNSVGSFAVLPFGHLVDEFGVSAVVSFSGVAIAFFWCFVGTVVTAYRRIELPGVGEASGSRNWLPRLR